MVSYTFPLRDLKLRVVGGRWGAPGMVQFILAGQFVDSVGLPKMQWAVLAILADAATKAPVRSLDAFVSSRQLASQLKERGLVDIADAQNAIRIVYSLRKRLEKFAIAEVFQRFCASEPTSKFANVLITRDKLLGYRINLHPDNLELELPT